MSSTVPAEVPSPVRDQSSTHAEDSDYFGVLSRKRLSSGPRSSTSRAHRVSSRGRPNCSATWSTSSIQVQERVGPRVAGVLAEEEPHAPPATDTKTGRCGSKRCSHSCPNPSCRYPAAARATSTTRRIGITSSTDPGSHARPWTDGLRRSQVGTDSGVAGVAVVLSGGQPRGPGSYRALLVVGVAQRTRPHR
jgi:hypothetical protein